MHILLCHERFLARFGADRLLLRCAREFRQHGHRVTLVGCDFDPIEAPAVADHLIQLPPAAAYIHLDVHTCRWLSEKWTELFVEQPPDVAVVAGWPFFSALRLFSQRGCRTIFCDCGITPSEGLSEGGRKTMHLLAGLKGVFVPLADAIAPISDFLLESQTRAVAAPGQLLRTIHLSGAHVLEQPAAAAVQDAATAPLIIALGRYEPGNYKQSEWVVPFVSELIPRHPALQVGVLTTPEQIAELPSEVRRSIVPLGHPDDGELHRLMRAACCTVVFSRWEGFNLPLAEAAALGVHCLVLNSGAHSEVVPHPWYLCADLPEMIAKAAALISGTAPVEIADHSALAGYGERRTWVHVAQEYLALVDEIMTRPAREARPHPFIVRRDALWLIDVTNAAHDPANSGVVRVCRRLSAELQKMVPAIFVVWDHALRTHRFPYDAEFDQLSQFGGPQRLPSHPSSFPGEPFLLSHYLSGQEAVRGWLVIPEIRHEPDFSLLRSQAAAWGLRMAAVFHDAIPLLRPDLVSDPVYRDGHLAYMRGLAECHVVLPNSQTSAEALEQFWRAQGFVNASPTTCLLPGGTAGQRPPPTVSNRPMILCVSTLEPRKGHRRLIDAFMASQGRMAESWELVLVGSRYAGAPEIAAHIEEVTRSCAQIRWLGIVPDDELVRLYQECAFTVFASEMEGFGLPILESLWHGRPCLCHHNGVMAELARPGGCLTADLTDSAVFAEALGRLMIDDALRKRLRAEAAQRSIKTWTDYGTEFLGHLLLVERVHGYEPPPPPTTPMRWDHFLYPDCLLEHWQMNESERMAVAALLARIKPRVSIEVGTFRGGSLSLIRQHSQIVFSIDIDPTVRTDFGWMQNVSFLTGNSREVLPPLFNALEVAALSPEFILIDGDHSADGARADIECILDFVPRRPCVVVMHDTANPICRAGQLAARWARSPYVHYIDLDLVPGRIVEHGGDASGEVWGGLGFALLLPEPRSHTLTVGATASRMIEKLQSLTARG